MSCKFRAGDVVRITSGSFAGVQGVIGEPSRPLDHAGKVVLAAASDDEATLPVLVDLEGYSLVVQTPLSMLELLPT